MDQEQGWWGRRKQKKEDEKTAAEAERREEYQKSLRRAKNWNAGHLLGEGVKIPDIYSSDQMKAMTSIDMAYWALFDGEQPPQVIASANALRTNLVLVQHMGLLISANNLGLPTQAFVEHSDFYRLVAVGVTYSRDFKTVSSDTFGTWPKREEVHAALSQSRAREQVMASVAAGTSLLIAGIGAWSVDFATALGVITHREMDANPRLKTVGNEVAFRSCSLPMLVGACLSESGSHPPIKKLQLTLSPFEDPTPPQP